ncbi:pantoate--beta-alanine ligase [Virgibacillus indicus]|uniref:Pantothenate synthetase n=1 Tax=Virgibacillus indicus TaxID=2024554 RepID=A0A265NF98_9BACI|nr:pantoate--beta-alanine ligase [Virgibacillus indicus]OZU90134.1 pantoate--beta-alanine ligase [Virgibacillus indicus]
MKVIRSINSIQKQMTDLIKQGKQIGFVPTMGFFHEGHISLMRQARNDNDIVITSIFVNPLQFGPSEDFEQYPRNEEKDAKIAEEIDVDYLFMPDVSEMYPEKMSIDISINNRVNVLCGRSRPGHFDGVITVLTKLFNIVRPDKVYFGMKDAQQVAVVDALITNLNFPIELIGLPTVREGDGLAKSSRNVYLKDGERSEAIWLSKALIKGQELVVDGEKNPDIIVKEVINTLKQQTNSKLDYVELLSYPELQPVSVINEQVILAAAVYFERARLIDNLIFDSEGRLNK